MISIIPPFSTYYGLWLHIVLNGNNARSCNTTPFIDKTGDWSCRIDVRLRYVKAKGRKTIFVIHWNVFIRFYSIVSQSHARGRKLFLFGKWMPDSHCPSNRNQVSMRNQVAYRFIRRTFESKHDKRWFLSLAFSSVSGRRPKNSPPNARSAQRSVTVTVMNSVASDPKIKGL